MKIQNKLSVQLGGRQEGLHTLQQAGKTGTSSTISRHNLQKVCSRWLAISLGRQRAASTLPSPACLTVGQSTKPLLPSNHAIKQAHQQAHFQPFPLHVAYSCEGPDFESPHSASFSVLPLDVSILLLSEALSPILTFYFIFYLSQLDCSKNFTSCPHNFCCFDTQLFWQQHATTLIAQQIISVRFTFPVSPTQTETTGVFFEKEKQRLDNWYL